MRGVGSIFYVVCALGSGHFTDQDALWRVEALVIVGRSSATPVMRMLDRIRVRAAAASDGRADTPV